MKRLMLMLIVMSVLSTATAMAGSYNYVEPAQLKQWMESGKALHTVDIQVLKDFQRHHLKGSLQTNAFPVKTEEQKQMLETVVPKLSADSKDVVVVCPRGGGGAKKAYEYLQERGIAEKRLYILKDGIAGWPYKEMIVSGIR